MTNNSYCSGLRMLQVEASDCPFTAHFESIFNAIPDALVFVDTERRIIMSNPAVEKIFGYKNHEVLGQRTDMFYTCTEDFEEQGEILSNLRVEEKLKPYKMKYRKKNGEIFISETVAAKVTDQQGVVLGYLGLMRDISQRQVAIDKLRQAELNYRTIANFTYDWEYWVDAESSLRYVSPTCERITGYRPEEFTGNKELLRQIIVEEDKGEWDQHVIDSDLEIKLRELQFRIKRRDGTVRWIEHACQPVYDEDSNFLGFRASNRDISERKETESELRQALAEIKVLKEKLEAESDYLREEINLEHNFNNIIGQSNALQYVLFKVEQIASSDTSVILLGETGTGKELIARAIHNTSSRNKRPLVKVNCAALPSELIESELFGHERGAFTNAHEKRLGRFEIADGATIFLDEIGELPLALQAKLLRILQDGEFERLGSSKTRKVDVRVIAATNRDLEKDIEKGSFRKDLWYRLNVFPITVPPLRDRQEDVPLLVEHFMEIFARKQGKSVRSVATKEMQKLKSYSWPGNIRELENVIERAVINSNSSKLKLVDNLAGSGKELSFTLKPLKEMEREYILEVLQRVNWKVSGKNSAADILQVDRSTLRARMKKLGIQKPS